MVQPNSGCIFSGDFLFVPLELAPYVLPVALFVGGLATAALSGVAGVGGGTVLIAVLYALGLPPQVAVPLHAAVQLVSNASRTVAYRQAVEWKAAGWFLLGALPAPLLVAPWVAKANPHIVGLAIAGFIVVSVFDRANRVARLPARTAFFCAGVLNGSLGMFVGATGLFLNVLFKRPEWSRQTFIGTLAMCQFLGHASKLVGFGLAGISALARPDFLVPLVAAMVLGTALGKWLNGRVSEAQFQRLLNGILLVLAAQLAWSSGRGLLGV